MLPDDRKFGLLAYGWAEKKILPGQICNCNMILLQLEEKDENLKQ